MLFSLLLLSLVQSVLFHSSKEGFFLLSPFAIFHQQKQMFVLQANGLHGPFSFSDSQMPL